MHSSRFSAPGTSHYAFIRILGSWHLSLCTHQDSQLLALLILHSSGFSAAGTSLYALIRIISSWHFSLCIHQDSQLLTPLIMPSPGFSAGALGCSGKLPSHGATAPQQNKSQMATTHRVASRFASDPARGKGVKFCLPFERHSRGGRRNANYFCD